MTEIDEESARSLLRDLVETPSVSGSEAACVDRLGSFFRSAGRETWVDEVGNLRAPGNNGVLLTSHVDTVPGEIPVRVEDGVLWGRGSVDAKGPLAALAVAAVETGASFVGVVQEEVDSTGARHLVEDREAPEAVINGEPSGWDAITLGYRGIQSGTYRSTTESAHTSRPEPNAIQHAIRWWRSVEAAFENDEDDPLFEQVTAKPIEVTGGTSEDGFDVESSLAFQLRIPPSESPASVRASAAERVTAGDVEWKSGVGPVMESPRNPVARALRQGIRTREGDPTHLRKTGTSDMNVYASAWDVPMATYGPGDSSLDHTPEERLSLEEFDRAVDVLSTAAGALLAES